MNLTAEQLLTAVLALPDDDRRALAEAVIASLEPLSRPPFDDAWREVIARRSAELRARDVAAIPWADVKRSSPLTLLRRSSG